MHLQGVLSQNPRHVSYLLRFNELIIQNEQRLYAFLQVIRIERTFTILFNFFKPVKLLSVFRILTALVIRGPFDATLTYS